MRAGREVVIVDAVRTAVGRGHPTKGVFRDTHPNDLLAPCLRAIVERSGISPERIDDVITGCVIPYGEQSVNPGRNAWLQAGLPDSVPATTVDRQCGSGQQAVGFAAAMIACGMADVVVAGGVEHMGRLGFPAENAVTEQYGTPWASTLGDHPVSQGVCAERVADQWGIGRQELDELSLRSHRLAAEATTAGRLAQEIVAADGVDGPVTVDQGIRPGTTMEALGQLEPAFQEGGQVTAGNSSQISDGAAALMLCAADEAARLGLTPRAVVVDHLVVGVDPVLMLTGPAPATETLLERNGLTIGDIGRFEVNEAFAAVLAMWLRETGADLDTVNVNGGSIALGHPLGASGARLLTTLLYELERSDSELGVVTMCARGGLGTGTLLRRL
jgi:acetyl-CoA acetyltransferase family protein